MKTSVPRGIACVLFENFSTCKQQVIDSQLQDDCAGHHSYTGFKNTVVPKGSYFTLCLFKH